MDKSIVCVFWATLYMYNMETDFCPRDGVSISYGPVFVCLWFVCLFVCLSHTVIVSKGLHGSSCFCIQVSLTYPTLCLGTLGYLQKLVYTSLRNFFFQILVWENLPAARLPSPSAIQIVYRPFIDNTVATTMDVAKCCQHRPTTVAR